MGSKGRGNWTSIVYREKATFAAALGDRFNFHAAQYSTTVAWLSQGGGLVEAPGRGA